MGTKMLLSAGEYLRTSFPDLDREFRDGEVEERALPDYLHSKTQAFLIAFFFALRKTHFLFPRPELRVRLREELFLIPDVAVFQGVEPEDAVPRQAPLVIAEILSPGDSMTEVHRKLRDYHGWGVPHIWLVDPHEKVLYAFDGKLREVPKLAIPEFGIEIVPAEIFE